VLDAETLFLANLALIDQVVTCICRRHHLRSDEAEEFASLVRMKLIGNYAVLRKFQGRSSLATYLTAVVQRLYLDHRNQQWGRWRPSAHARRVGPLAVLLETLLVRDGQSFEEACEILRLHHRVHLSRLELATLAAALPPRAMRRQEGEELIQGFVARDAPPEERLLAKEREQMRRRLAQALSAALGDLAPDDRLLVRLRVEQGLPFVDIARALHLEARPLYRRMGAILRALRRRLEELGFAAAEVAVALAESDDAGLSPRPVEKPQGRVVSMG
jgi:RNA polymerase sigma factor for flagellar operon FliA